MALGEMQPAITGLRSFRDSQSEGFKPSTRLRRAGNANVAKRASIISAQRLRGGWEQEGGVTSEGERDIELCHFCSREALTPETSS